MTTFSTGGSAAETGGQIKSGLKTMLKARVYYVTF